MTFSFNLFSQKKCSEEIQTAVENGNFKLIQEFINKGGNINCTGEWKQTLLMMAIQNGKEEIANYLINHNADIKKVDEDNSSALFKTNFHGLIDIANNLITKGSKINKKGYNGMTTLMISANRNKLELVKLLINKGAEINTQCDNGYTALTYTTDPKVLIFLLSKNADINLKNFEGMNALEQFKWSLDDIKGYGTEEMIKNHTEIVEILKKY